LPYILSRALYTASMLKNKKAGTYRQKGIKIHSIFQPSCPVLIPAFGQRYRNAFLLAVFFGFKTTKSSTNTPGLHCLFDMSIPNSAVINNRIVFLF
jgi:hypothetical protein